MLEGDPIMKVQVVDAGLRRHDGGRLVCIAPVFADAGFYDEGD